MNSFVKKTLIFAVVMLAVAAVGWGGRKAYKKATERRLVSDARGYLEKKDFRNAGLSLQRALQVNPMSVEACNLTADMLDAGGAPAALSWRIRASQLQTNNVDYRLAWAQTALRLGDKESAAQALSGVDEKTKTTAAFHKLAGAFAWSLNNPLAADQHYSEALRLEPTNQAVVLNLSTVRLTATNQTVVTQARQTLENIPTNSPLRMVALRYLTADARANKSWDRALRYSQEVVSGPQATQSDRIVRLQVLGEARSPAYQPWRTALEEDARKSSDHAFAFGRWMALAEGPTNTMRWLQSLPVSVQTNQPVPLLLTDCQMALMNWKGLLATVQKQDWGDANFYRLALESLALRGLGQALPSKNAWQKSARIASQRLDRLARLAQVTAVWGWRPEGTEILLEIVDKFPKEKWAADQLIEMLYADGNSRALSDLLVKMHSADPADNRRKNNLASISLLRKSNLENAHKMAREAFNSEPENPFFISTYAYSLLLQNRPEEAVKALGGLKADFLKVPSIAVYYGVVQAQAGHKDVAKEPLKLAETARLLPEEIEIVRLAKARM